MINHRLAFAFSACTRIKDANLPFTVTGRFTKSVYFTLKRQLTIQSPQNRRCMISTSGVAQKGKKIYLRD
ncbi:hypothetical protein [Mycetohabitans endofungorum]|uniref:hypothetical protein n=1 Tax=Mycetohabitans endofungorum TaxID=417203 RepID=UPI002B05D7B5|nr:hypothetical protein [Mycetohabitans endofungorum]